MKLKQRRRKPVLDKNFFFKIGPEIVACFRNSIFMKGQDIDGNRFKPYSKEYAEDKASRHGNDTERQ